MKTKQILGAGFVAFLAWLDGCFLTTSIYQYCLGHDFAPGIFLGGLGLAVLLFVFFGLLADSEGK